MTLAWWGVVALMIVLARFASRPWARASAVLAAVGAMALATNLLSA